MKVTIDAPEYQYYDHVVKFGASQPNTSATLEDNDGSGVDLTGATVRFRVSSRGSDTREVDDQATITDAVNGKVVYMWSGDEVDEEGVYNADFAVDYSGNTGTDFEPDEYFPSDEYLSVYVMEGI